MPISVSDLEPDPEPISKSESVPVVEPVPIPEPVPVPKKNFCPNCGTKLREGAKFCAGCGKRLQESSISYTGGSGFRTTEVEKLTKAKRKGFGGKEI